MWRSSTTDLRLSPRFSWRIDPNINIDVLIIPNRVHKHDSVSDYLVINPSWFIFAMISLPKNITRWNMGLVTFVFHLTNDGMMSLIVTGLEKLSPTICRVPTILDVRLMLNFELNTDHKFILLCSGRHIAFMFSLKLFKEWPLASLDWHQLGPDWMFFPNKKSS